MKVTPYSSPGRGGHPLFNPVSLGILAAGVPLVGLGAVFGGLFGLVGLGVAVVVAAAAVPLLPDRTSARGQTVGATMVERATGRLRDRVEPSDAAHVGVVGAPRQLEVFWGLRGVEGASARIRGKRGRVGVAVRDGGFAVTFRTEGVGSAGSAENRDLRRGASFGGELAALVGAAGVLECLRELHVVGKGGCDSYLTLRFRDGAGLRGVVGESVDPLSAVLDLVVPRISRSASGYRLAGPLDQGSLVSLVGSVVNGWPFVFSRPGDVTDVLPTGVPGRREYGLAWTGGPSLDFYAARFHEVSEGGFRALVGAVPTVHRVLSFSHYVSSAAASSRRLNREELKRSEARDSMDPQSAAALVQAEGSRKAAAVMEAGGLSAVSVVVMVREGAGGGVGALRRELVGIDLIPLYGRGPEALRSVLPW